MKKITLTLSLLLMTYAAVTHAQLQNVNWYFGDRTGLNFATSPPTVLTDNSYLLEGVAATVSDPTSGNLLFYTDGFVVYNSSHSIMRNGEDLFGGGATLIVPYPEFPDKYLIFTEEPFTGFGTGLNYSVVDMTGDLGLGEVVDKNINLLPVSSEKMTITQTTDGSAYWLIVLAPQDSLSEENTTLYSYKIDANGINLVTQTTFSFSMENAIAEVPAGQMKISPDNQNIALVRNVRYILPRSTLSGVTASATDPNMPPERIYTFDFDETTGAITNMQSSYDLSGYNTFYGLEFSSDSNLLYVTEQSDILGATGKIYQIEYRNSAAEFPINMVYDSNSTVGILGLQRAYDNKIYAITDDPYYLSVINSPDLIGQTSDFVLNSISFDHLTGDVESARDLPQLVPDILRGVSIPPLLKLFNTSYANDTITKIKALDTGVVVFGTTGTDNSFGLPGPDSGFVAKFNKDGTLENSDTQATPYQFPLGIDQNYYKWDTLSDSYNLNGLINKNYILSKYDGDNNLIYQIITTNIIEDFVDDANGNSYLLFKTSSNKDISITGASGNVWNKSASQMPNLDSIYYSNTFNIAKFDSQGTLKNVIELLDYKSFRDTNGGTVPVDFPAKVFGDNSIYFTTSSKDEGIYTDAAKITLANGEIFRKGEWLIAYDLENSVYQKAKLLSQNGSVTPNDLIYMQSTLFTKRKNILYKLDANLNEVDSLITTKLDILEYNDVTGTFLIRGDSKNIIKKIDLNFDEIWSKDLGNKFTIDNGSEAPNGDIYVSGSYTEDARLFNPDRIDLPLAYGTDTFVAKIAGLPAETVAKSSNSVIIEDTNAITDVPQAFKKDAILIYPNPFENSLSIDNSSENIYSIEIYSDLGRLVYEVQNVGKKEQKINLGSIKSGLYYVKIKDANSNVVNKKVIKI